MTQNDGHGERVQHGIRSDGLPDVATYPEDFQPDPLADDLYPIPWLTIGRHVLARAGEYLGSEWRRRTWWGKAKLAPVVAVAALLAPIAAVVIACLLVAADLRVLLVPVKDLEVRIRRRLPAGGITPPTYKQGER